MCEPASIMTALKVAGTVFATYSAVKGLKEGNIMAAVVGGIGAYAGFTSLAQAYGQQVGAGAAKAAAPDVMGELAAKAAPKTMETVAGGVFDVVSDPFNIGKEAVSGITESATQPALDASLEYGASGASTLSDASKAISGVNSNLINPIDSSANLLKGNSLLKNPQTAALQQGPNPTLNAPSPTNPVPKEPGFMDKMSDGYDGLKGLLGDNQQLIGYAMQSMGAKEQQDFLEEQLRKREEKEERLRGYAAATPTYQYGYGGTT